MIKSILFALSLSLMVCSCYKVSNQPPPDTPPTFTITLGQDINGNNGGNIADSIITISIHDSESFTINLGFTITSGSAVNHPVTCSVSGLPPGIVPTTPDSLTFGLSDGISFTFSLNADTGLYTINVNVQANGSMQAYPLRIHVLPVVDGAPTLVGTYSGDDPCGHFSIGDVWYTYTATVATVTGMPHWISIKNYRGISDSVVVYAFVTCTDAYHPWVGTINIPKQTTDGYTIFGNGTGYYGISEQGAPWISVYGDTIIHIGDTQTCYTQLTQ